MSKFTPEYIAELRKILGYPETPPGESKPFTITLLDEIERLQAELTDRTNALVEEQELTRTLQEKLNETQDVTHLKNRIKQLENRCDIMLALLEKHGIVKQVLEDIA